jgi:hypothetical protein
MEYHCGRLQGITRAQALEICAEEGITYQEFRSQGGADVLPPTNPPYNQLVLTPFLVMENGDHPRRAILED